MASIWQSARNLIGSGIGSLGQAVGAPEMGMSELFSGQQPNYQMGWSNTPSFGTRTSGGGTVQGATNTGSGAATTGGSILDTLRNQLQNVPTQNQPSYSEPDWNALYAPAMEAYTNLQNTIQGGLGEQLSGIEAKAGTEKTALKTEEAKRLGEYTGQEEAATASTKSTMAQTRRQASEMMQGIQRLYGGTTSAGGAFSEILGSKAMQTMGEARNALQLTLGEIGRAKTGVKDEVLLGTQKIDQQSEQLKADAQQNLRLQLAQIGLQRGQLETQKAAKRTEYLQNYQNQLAQIEQNNQQFKQQLFLKAQEFAYSLATLQAKAVGKYKVNLTDVIKQIEQNQFDIGGKTYGGYTDQSGNFRYIGGGSTTDENDENDWDRPSINNAIATGTTP